MSTGVSVLIAEDDARARESLRQLLEEEGYAVVTAGDGLSASRALHEGAFDAVLVDIRMPGKDGLQLTREAKALASAPAVLVMTAYGNSSVAIEAMKAGAYDYLTKPLHFDELRIQLERAIRSRKQAQELISFQALAGADREDAEMIGDSAPMQQVYKWIGQVAPTDSTVLIRGESGTGKELVARAIHRHSRRNYAPFVPVNCAAIPEGLLESELFGHEKGAFTGAAARRRGRLELANRGTVFLDEIGELSPATQSKLLRALQDRTVERLGSEQRIQLDLRFVTATNRDLEAMVRAREFREDLYYRLNVVVIHVPPLRERRDDIPRLAEHFLAKVAARQGSPPVPVTPDALDALSSRDWPGNVRELEHTLERAAVLSRGAPIAPEHLQEQSHSRGEWFDAVPLDDGMHALVAQLERKLVERALRQAGGNRTRAAELLRINRRLLYDKLKEFGLE
jgi:two-component system response regulator AtoC